MNYKPDHHGIKARTVSIIFKLMIAVFLLGNSFALADIYHWTDDKGVLHLTDDIRNVPEEYREKAGVIKTKPAREGPVVEPLPPPPAVTEPLVEEEAQELYGGQTLQWWKLQFHILKKEIETVEAHYFEKRRFVEVYEKGRRFGQIFETGELYLYERYKREIVWDEERLEELRAELEELRRSARGAGVPREVRK
jgi:hypothetical protein